MGKKRNIRQFHIDDKVIKYTISLSKGYISYWDGKPYKIPVKEYLEFWLNRSITGKIIKVAEWSDNDKPYFDEFCPYCVKTYYLHAIKKHTPRNIKINTILNNA